MSKKVFIGVGHGGTDSGRVSKGINSVAILPRKEKIEKANIITEYTL